MRCRSVRPLLPLAAGGDLTDDVLRRVRAHVADCTHCRTEFHDVEDCLTVLTEARELAPRRGSSVWQRVGPRLAASRNTHLWWQHGVSLRHLAGACAAVVAFALVVAVVPRGEGGPDDGPVAQGNAGITDPMPRNGAHPTTTAPMFVLDSGAPTWRHDMPDTVVPRGLLHHGSARPVYVLEQGRATFTSAEAQEF